MMRVLYCLMAIIGLVLGGCGARHDDLDQFMEDTKAKPGGKLQSLPQFVPTEPFAYSAAGLRSPFERPSSKNEDRGSGARAKAPDMSRAKEFLEGINIDQLSFVGTMAGSDGKLWALISDGNGGVHRVAEGNYLGRNYGLIKKVYEDKVDVVEVVPDGHSGWLERPRVIAVKESGSSDKVAKSSKK